MFKVNDVVRTWSGNLSSRFRIEGIAAASYRIRLCNPDDYSYKEDATTWECGRNWFERNYRLVYRDPINSLMELLDDT